MKKLILVSIVSLILGLTIGITIAKAVAPKITVGKYTYMTLDANGKYTNAQGVKYNYVSGYLGWFLRDGIIYFQGVDCSKIPAGTTPYFDQKTGCYYEYGVDTDYPRFLYGNAVLPSPQ